MLCGERLSATARRPLWFPVRMRATESSVSAEKGRDCMAVDLQLDANMAALQTDRSSAVKAAANST
jgi:hypothetical protein